MMLTRKEADKYRQIAAARAHKVLRGQSSDVIDDAVQHALLYMLEREPALAGRHRDKFLIYSIYNGVRDFYRKYERDNRFYIESLDINYLEGKGIGPQTESDQDTKLLRKELEELLDEVLNEPFKTIYWLRINGSTLEEISEHTINIPPYKRITVSNINYYLSLAHKKLNRYIED